jgi:TonB family protein
MNDDLIGKLDESLSELLAGREPKPGEQPPLSELMATAREFSLSPRPAFRARLRGELDLAAGGRSSGAAEGLDLIGVSGKPNSSISSSRLAVTPPLFSSASLTFPMRGSHLAVSFGLHVVALSLIAASGLWVVQHPTQVRTVVSQLIPNNDDYVLPVAPGTIGGGGGGGDRDKMEASHGTAPRFAAEQLTPPMAVVRNESPKLTAEPTVVGPPDLVLPQSDKLGDPMANILNPPSNGTGSGGGIGSGSGGGIGSGIGPGVGEGRGGGIGGGVYRVGGGVSAPRPIYDPDPEYSEEARRAKFQGIVLITAVIGPDGRPRELRVARSLGMGLDQKALDAVWKWRFTPAMKDNHPVSVQVSIEVAFRLY